VWILGGRRIEVDVDAVTATRITTGERDVIAELSRRATSWPALADALGVTGGTLRRVVARRHCRASVIARVRLGLARIRDGWTALGGVH